MDGPDAQVVKEASELIFDDVGKRAHDKQRPLGIGFLNGQMRHERGETGVLALGERRLDAAAGIIEHAHARRQLLRESAGGA